MTDRLAALCVLLITALVSTPAGAFTPIAVTVREPDGLARRHWPLTVSVPFPRGALHRGAPVKLVDERGAGAAVQARPLATWPDGSVRWLLIDTQVDLDEHSERRLRVEPGRSPAPAASVRVTEGKQGMVIDTGPIRLTVPKQHFAIVEDLRVHGSDRVGAGPLGATLVADEHTMQAQPPTRVAATEKGPLRAAVQLEGTYGDGFDYVVRIEAYAGQPMLRISHTFINRHPTPYVGLARLGVELPLAGVPPSHYRYGLAGGRAVGGRLSDAGLRLYQSDNEKYAVDGKMGAGKLAGWIEANGTGPAVGLAARWMWEQYPQSIGLQRDRLVYDLWSPEAEPGRAGVGAAKTHEFVIWTAPERVLPQDAAEGMARPLLGVVDPTWVARSGALPQAIAPQGATEPFVRTALAAAHRYLQRNAIERWDDCGAVRCDAATPERPRTGAFGMWNWGDWNFRGYRDTTKGTDSWGNLEYDTAYVLALTYAATGDAEVHDQMVAAARHFMDVDTIHACPPRPEWVGMNHPKNPLHFSFELGGPDLGHTWTQGSLAYYYLTGDRSGLEAARGVADYLVRRAGSFGMGNPRQWGWPQIALLAVYDATHEPKYLEAALAYARGGMRAHPPTASVHWKVGILADALAYTHAATGDAEIKKWLLDYAAGVMQHRAQEDPRALPAVAYVAALTGNAAMREAARAAAARLDLGNWGKPFSVNGRLGFRIESLLSGPAPRAPAPKRHATKTFRS